MTELIKLSLLGSGLFFLLLLVGCGGSSDTPKMGQVTPETEPELTPETEPELTPETEPELNVVGLRIVSGGEDALRIVNEEVVGRTFMLTVEADLADGGIVDVTQWVDWQITYQNCLEPCVVLDDSSNQLRANAIGRLDVVALYNGITTIEVSFEIIGKLGLCGGQIDDNGTHIDECLKIINGKMGDATDKWFTSPPTRSVVDLLGYVEVNAASNSGRSFASFYTTGASGVLTPPQTEYALMRYDGLDWFEESGAGGQYARYCADLGEMRFNGRDNWRTAKASELQDLFWGEGSDLYNRYYWPANSVYISSTRHLSWSEVVMLSIYPLLGDRDQANVSEIWRNHYPSCVSEPR